MLQLTCHSSLTTDRSPCLYLIECHAINTGGGYSSANITLTLRWSASLPGLSNPWEETSVSTIKWTE